MSAWLTSDFHAIPFSERILVDGLLRQVGWTKEVLSSNVVLSALYNVHVLGKNPIEGLQSIVTRVKGIGIAEEHKEFAKVVMNHLVAIQFARARASLDDIEEKFSLLQVLNVVLTQLQMRIDMAFDGRGPTTEWHGLSFSIRMIRCLNLEYAEENALLMEIVDVAKNIQQQIRNRVKSEDILQVLADTSKNPHTHRVYTEAIQRLTYEEAKDWLKEVPTFVLQLVGSKKAKV